MDYQIPLVALLGFVASFLSNISGGGGALISLPILLRLGIPPLEAIGTIRVGSLGLLAGSFAETRGKNIIRTDHFKPLLVVIVLASIIGPQVSTNLSNDTVKLISSVFVVITACASLASWKIASNRRDVSKWSKLTGYILYFLVVTILAGFGSGLGIMANYVLIGFLGMTALETLATRRFMGLFAVPIQLVAFALTGHINFSLGAAMLVGSLAGGMLGIRLAIKKGNEFVKRAMAIASILLVLSLFI